MNFKCLEENKCLQVFSDMFDEFDRKKQPLAEHRRPTFGSSSLQLEWLDFSLTDQRALGESR